MHGQNAYTKSKNGYNKDMRYGYKKLLEEFKLKEDNLTPTADVVIHADELPDFENVIGFNEVKTFKGDRSKTMVHFFIDDYQFLRTWNDLEKWTEILGEFRVVLGPDFSMYPEFPEEVNRYEHWRACHVMSYWQREWEALPEPPVVIPTLQWTDAENAGYCSKYLGPFGWYAISTVGLATTGEIEAFQKGLRAMCEKLSPKGLLVFGPLTYVPVLLLNKDRKELGLGELEIKGLNYTRGKGHKWEAEEEAEA